MHRSNDVPKVRPKTSMVDVFLEMSKKGFGTVAITKSDNVLLGVITDGDLRRNIDGLMIKYCNDIMTPNPHVVTKEVLASSALSLMNKEEISSVFVVDKENKVLGILHIHDCLRAGVK